MTLLLPLLLLTTVVVGSLGTAGWVLWRQRQRQLLLRRLAGTGPATAPGTGLAGSAPGRSLSVELMDWLAARVPAQLGAGKVSASRLVHAGFARKSDQAVYALLRVVSLLLVPAVALLIVPGNEPLLVVVALIGGASAGLVLPPAMLNHLVAERQWAIRRAIPDALDVLVVCVEAGMALDPAIQRVARELVSVHPILASEFLTMTRRVAAGMPREQALHMLYLRTGVDELRGLGSHLLQSDRWGTSVGTVLRTYSDQVRHRRRTTAEKRAATAATKMLIPLMLFIFPVMFIVLLAPAVMQLSAQF